MAYIINIETATHICSVALSENGKTVALKESHEDKTHAELLSVFIDEILKENNLTPQDLSAIAFSKGPGSYTGLRIGLSVAKGLCYGLNIPLISIPTLTAMAIGAKLSKTNTDYLCPMIDARRMEVYTSIFDKNNNIIEDVHAKIIDTESFGEILKENSIAFFGTGSEKCKEMIQSENALFIDHAFISAKFMSELSYQKFIEEDVEDVAYFEPFYLKEFQAIKSTKKPF